MSYESGEIYFVREQDAAGALTEFVKIGLVKGKRTSEERLIEHQTGNPRKLVIPQGHIVKTDAVTMVEAQLHKRYATDRIGGEWFRFRDESLLESALNGARELSLEVAKIVPILKAADDLEKTASTDEVKPVTAEAVAHAKRMEIAKERLKLAKNLAGTISQMMKVLQDQGEDLSNVATVRSVTFKPKFDQTKFLEDFPELFEKYKKIVEGWSQRFLVKLKLPEDFEIGQDFLSDLNSIQALMPNAGEKFTASDLQEPSLRLTQLTATVEWERDIAEANLKILCGDAAGIEGICTWKREATNKEVFDLEALMENDFALYSDYLKDERTEEYLITTRGTKRK